jgi:hypothetical protein
LALPNNLSVASAKRVFDIESEIREGEFKVDHKNAAEQQEIAATRFEQLVNGQLDKRRI